MRRGGARLGVCEFGHSAACDGGRRGQRRSRRGRAGGAHPLLLRLPLGFRLAVMAREACAVRVVRRIGAREARYLELAEPARRSQERSPAIDRAGGERRGDAAMGFSTLRPTAARCPRGTTRSAASTALVRPASTHATPPRSLGPSGRSTVARITGLLPDPESGVQGESHAPQRPRVHRAAPPRASGSRSFAKSTPATRLATSRIVCCSKTTTWGSRR